MPLWWSEAPLRGRRVSRRGPSGESFFLLWEAKLAPSWLQDRIFSHFFRIFSQDASKLRFLAFSDGFSMDFGMFWEGFGAVLIKFFHAFSKKCYSLKNSVFPRENQ